MFKSDKHKELDARGDSLTCSVERKEEHNTHTTVCPSKSLTPHY